MSLLVAFGSGIAVGLAIIASMLTLKSLPVLFRLRSLMRELGIFKGLVWAGLTVLLPMAVVVSCIKFMMFAERYPAHWYCYIAGVIGCILGMSWAFSGLQKMGVTFQEADPYV